MSLLLSLGEKRKELPFWDELRNLISAVIMITRVSSVGNLVHGRPDNHKPTDF
jgi:hypothetical protein